MTGVERRKDLLNTLRKAESPVSGAVLAEKYQVSRQVIVQDIALLRASEYEVDSTPRGYRLAAGAGRREVPKHTVPSSVSRIFHVSHTDSQIEDELNLFVDNGGSVRDVFIEHAAYGSIRADLPIKCRRHVQEFMESIRCGKSSPLKNLTSGVHYHTVEADSEATLDLIGQELEKKGYLI